MLQFTQTLTNHELSRIGLSNAKARHKLDTGIIHGQAQVQNPLPSEPKSILKLQLNLRQPASFLDGFPKEFRGYG